MNRLLLVLALLLAAAFAAYETMGSDSLYWKRRLLLAVVSPANLPASYFEPCDAKYAFASSKKTRARGSL